MKSVHSVREANRRFKRKLRKQRRHVEDITTQADKSLNKFVFRRFGRLFAVRRFMVSWLALLFFIAIGSVWQVRGLDQYYLEVKPSGGGTYREGMLGTFTTANPLFAVNPVDASVAELVFSGLFRLSPTGKLESDLAESFTVNEEGDTYTVLLRSGVAWHDGTPFTAKDVVFTYETIKNPNAKSPLFSGWRDVTVRAVDDTTVTFSLPNSLSSFRYSMINGILPHHILKDVSVEDLRTSQFNTVNPIGTGPFTYKSVEVIGVDPATRQEKITLSSNASFYRPRARIDGIQLRTYRDEETMLQAFKDKEIFAVAGLRSVPDTITNDEEVTITSTSLNSAVYLFLNTASPVLQDVKLRQALAHGTQVDEIRKQISETAVIPVDGPFLRSHFTYSDAQKQYGYDPARAAALLDEAGWLRSMDGQRMKEGVALKLRLVSQSLTEYATVVQQVQTQWGELGIEVEALLLPEEDVQSSAVVRHDYDVLLYGIALGADPDVFAFWHSSQADVSLKSRLNLSEFSNQAADTALEAGRTRGDNELRKVKYEPFTKAWIEQVPAIGLYQPRFQLVSSSPIDGYLSGEFSSVTDRFYAVNQWQIRRQKAIRQ